LSCSWALFLPQVRCVWREAPDAIEPAVVLAAVKDADPIHRRRLGAAHWRRRCGRFLA
jgi:hypothetical protein